MLDIPEGLDGFDLFSNMASMNDTSPRTEILHNIDPISENAAIRVSDYKLVINQNAGWGPNPRNTSETRSDVDDSGPFIFNFEKDPTESRNLYGNESYADVQQQLFDRLAFYNASAHPCSYPDPDPAAQPTPIEGLVVCTQDDGACRNLGVWKPWQ